MRVAVCVAISLLSIGVGDVRSQSRAIADVAAETAIRQRERQWEQALILGQQNVIDQIVAEDCLFVGSTGELLTKAQADADRRNTVLRSSTTTQMIVRVFGNVAVVIGTNVEQSSYAGQDTSGQYRWTDVFEKRGTDWVVVSAQSTRVDELSTTAAAATEPTGSAPGAKMAEAPANSKSAVPEVSVMLAGDAGSRFNGACMITAGQSVETREVAGVLPATYTFRANALNCVIGKQAASGLLQVQFVLNGRSIKDGSTRTPFGHVSLSIDGLR